MCVSLCVFCGRFFSLENLTFHNLPKPISLLVLDARQFVFNKYVMFIVLLGKSDKVIGDESLTLSS